MRPIYLDNNSTTSVYPEVASAISECLDSISGNPSSAHGVGRDAKKLVDEGRLLLMDFLEAASPSEIVFTSGGTESDNIPFLRPSESPGRHPRVITTKVEHEAVRRPAEKLERDGASITWLDVDREGNLDLDQLRQSLSDQTDLVSIMLANNETGVLFPMEEIGEIIKSKSNAIFHVDAVNAAGKIPLSMKDSTVDLLSISAHKMGGPKGIGALYVRNGVDIGSQMLGGGQEAGRRPGTEAVHQIVGFGEAARISKDLRPMGEVEKLRDKLESTLLSEFTTARVNGRRDSTCRLPNTSNISFPGINGELILNLLDEAGICVSTGSACNSESKTVSPVLKAMGVPFDFAMGSIRFSLGRANSEDELNTALPEIIRIVKSAGSIAGF
jgi:cysteine desulfurase